MCILFSPINAPNLIKFFSAEMASQITNVPNCIGAESLITSLKLPQFISNLVRVNCKH